LHRVSFLAELKVPADAEFIPAAKRLGASLGAQLGFSLDEIDELAIAVAQACDSTIVACGEIWGEGSGATMKLSYAKTDRGIAVEVEGVGPGSKALARKPGVHRDDPMRLLGDEMIRMFVDDFRSNLDTNRGRVHLRMVKYLIG
jgi:anti-sigma regulatory factor (Ser/Thr protein kinase)